MTDKSEGSKDALDQCSPFRSLSPRNHSQTPVFLRDSRWKQHHLSLNSGLIQEVVKESGNSRISRPLEWVLSK